MLRDESVAIESTWSELGGENKRESYREIDKQLRSIARKKTGLEVEEARWLREADQQRVWRKLGFSTALEYLEDVFGYSPRTAKDRLRVAKELANLPGLEDELRNGALPYSAARELTRVMTRANEAHWLARARGKNAHDIQELVSGHRKGDHPDDPKDPALMTRDVVFRLDSRRDALLQQARAMFEDERGEHLDEADLMEALCVRALEGNAASNDKPARPAHQIVIRKCECSRAWQETRGKLVEIKETDLELAECDAELVSEEELAAAVADGTRKPKATLTIPNKTRELVWARDQGRCRFPGCRATRNLALHHVQHQAHGGGHEAWNLIVLCNGHHTLLHDGVLSITGHAPDALVFMRDGKRLVDARAPEELRAAQGLRAAKPKTRSRFDDVVRFEEAKQALKQLGFKAREAKQALEEACAHVGTGADVATLVEKVLSMNRATNSPDELDDADITVLAKRALVQSGYPVPVAANAVDAAGAHVGTDADLPTLITEAFRRCTGT